jgi:predicted nucleotidyltransferase
MNEVSRKISSIQNLCLTHRVDKLYLFGSILGTNFTDNSDIDFLVKFKNIELLKYADNYFDLKFSLEELFNRPVDLLEEQTIKNPYFLEELNETKQLIYGS